MRLAHIDHLHTDYSHWTLQQFLNKRKQKKLLVANRIAVCSRFCEVLQFDLDEEAESQIFAVKDEQVRITTRPREAPVASTIVNGTVKLVNDAGAKLFADSFVPGISLTAFLWEPRQKVSIFAELGYT